mgnify:CR=1 FL=1
MELQEINHATPELMDAMAHLIPQVSGAPLPGLAELEEIASSPNSRLWIVRDPAQGGKITGTLTLALVRVPTGVRAWIEDVVVDTAARGQGIGEALVRTALEEAARAGAISVELTSRPSREAANRLYQRLGFIQPQTNFYRYVIRKPE